MCEGVSESGVTHRTYNFERFFVYTRYIATLTISVHKQCCNVDLKYVKSVSKLVCTNSAIKKYIHKFSIFSIPEENLYTLYCEMSNTGNGAIPSIYGSCTYILQAESIIKSRK